MIILRKIGSLKITLVLLFILAVSSIIGTVVAQHQGDAFYIQKYGAVIGNTILVLQADDFFNSIYYNILLFFLGLNLLACTVNSFKFVLLKKRRKLAIFLLHCGVLAVFTGGLISRFAKQEQRYTLLPDEKIVLPEKGAEVVFKDFSIEYYPNGKTPKEYRSRLEIFEGKILKKKHSLRVNHPLRYKGFSLYQSSFNALADVEIEIRHGKKVIWKGFWEHGKPLQLEGKNALSLEMTHFLPDVAVAKNGSIELRSYKLGNAAMLISAYRENEMVYEQWVFPFDEDMSGINQGSGIFDFQVKKITPVYSTVIQMIKDPGEVFVMGGFVLLLGGMILLLLKKKAE